MSEVEDFRAARESRADVVSRAGRSTGSADIVRRMVDAAIYRDTHPAEPHPARADDSESEAGAAGST